MAGIIDRLGVTDIEPGGLSQVTGAIHSCWTILGGFHYKMNLITNHVDATDAQLGFSPRIWGVLQSNRETPKHVTC